MKNLKRTLSLVLALALCFALLTIGASAKTYTDTSTVTYKDAVQWLTSLNVLNGYDNGDGTYSIKPTNPITRAEFTKLVCFVLNGGIEPVFGDVSSTSFKDTVGHWAAPSIEYLTSFKYISGYGEGLFGPDDTITGQQAAKILLTVLGYNATTEGLVGSGWASKADGLANMKGLYAGLVAGFKTTNLLTREQAAQIIWNAMQQKLVTYNAAGLAITDPTNTLLSVHFTVNRVEGVVIKNSWGDLTTTVAATTSNPTIYNTTTGLLSAPSAPTTGKLVICPVDKWIAYLTAGTDPSASYISFATDTTTADMLGESVRFAYTVPATTATGAVAANANIVGDLVVTSYNKAYSSATAGTVYSSTAGMSFDTTSAYKTKVLFNYGQLAYADASATGLVAPFGTSSSSITIPRGWSVQAIDFNGDGACDYVKYYVATPYQITSVTTTSATTKNLSTGLTGPTFTLSKTVNLSDLKAATLAVNDVVLAYQDGNGKTYIEKTTAFSGKVTATSQTTNSTGSIDYLKFEIDGVSYPMRDLGVKGDGCGVGLETKFNTTGTKLINIGTTATFYKDAAGYLVYADETSGGGVAGVVNVKFALLKYVDVYNYSAGGQYIEMVKTDGTDVTALVTKFYNAGTSKMAAISPSFIIPRTTTGATTQIIAYTTNDDGSLNVYDTGKNASNATPGTNLSLSTSYAGIKSTGTPLAFFTSDSTQYIGLSATNVPTGSYTGYTNVPAMTFSAANSLYIVTLADGFTAQNAIMGGAQIPSTSAAQCITQLFYTGATTTTASASKYFYLSSITSYGLSLNAAGALVRNYTAVVNGVSTPISVEEATAATLVKDTLYTISSYASDGTTINGVSLAIATLTSTAISQKIYYIDSSVMYIAAIGGGSAATYTIGASTIVIDKTLITAPPLADKTALTMYSYVYVVADSLNPTLAKQIYIVKHDVA